VNPEDVHVTLMGYDRETDYRINLEILRYNFSYSDKLWITTIHNGDRDKVPSGLGENNFIYMNENRGPVGGVIDSYNRAGAFAVSGYRPIVVFMNFDAWFITEQGFTCAIDEFLKSGKEFSAAIDNNHLPAPDCMIFKKDYLKKILPIQEKVWSIRETNPVLDIKYKPTQLGFENVEEYLYYTLIHTHDIESRIPYKENDNIVTNEQSFEILTDEVWHDMGRDGLPRLEWTERLTFLHNHNYDMKRELLKKYNITNGNAIQQFIGGA